MRSCPPGSSAGRLLGARCTCPGRHEGQQPQAGLGLGTGPRRVHTGAKAVSPRTRALQGDAELLAWVPTGQGWDPTSDPGSPAPPPHTCSACRGWGWPRSADLVGSSSFWAAASCGAPAVGLGGRVGSAPPVAGPRRGAPAHLPSSLRNSLVFSPSKFPHSPHILPMYFLSTSTCRGGHCCWVGREGWGPGAPQELLHRSGAQSPLTGQDPGLLASHWGPPFSLACPQAP